MQYHRTIKNTNKIYFINRKSIYYIITNFSKVMKIKLKYNAVRINTL